MGSWEAHIYTGFLDGERDRGHMAWRQEFFKNKKQKV